MATAKKKPAPKKVTPKPLPPMAAKQGECGVDGYCCQGKSPEDCCGGSCGGNCGCKTFMGCHIAGLFTDCKAWTMLVVAIAVMFVFDMLWHGHLMMPRYEETSYLWRPIAEMETLWGWCVAYHVILAFVFTAILLLTQPKTYMQGFKNGALIMAPLALAALSAWMHQNIPADITQMWAIGSLLQGAIAGLALTAVGHWFCLRKGGCCGGEGGCSV